MNTPSLSKQAQALVSDHAREVRFVPVPSFKSEAFCAEVGFYNWDRSAFIVDGIGYGPTEDTAAARAWLDWEAELRRPHVAEDSLGLGLLSEQIAQSDNPSALPFAGQGFPLPQLTNSARRVCATLASLGQWRAQGAPNRQGNTQANGTQQGLTLASVHLCNPMPCHSVSYARRQVTVCAQVQGNTHRGETRGMRCLVCECVRRGVRPCAYTLTLNPQPTPMLHSYSYARSIPYPWRACPSHVCPMLPTHTHQARLCFTLVSFPLCFALVFRTLARCAWRAMHNARFTLNAHNLQKPAFALGGAHSAREG